MCRSVAKAEAGWKLRRDEGKKKGNGKGEGERDFVRRANLLEGQHSWVVRIGKQRRTWVLKGHLWIAGAGKKLPRLVRERQ
jgi:hypothetical protein